MITKIIDENSISCVPEDSDDLIILRRVIKSGDKIVGETVRVVKQEKDFARPDKGERIKIRLSLEVENISKQYLQILKSGKKPVLLSKSEMKKNIKKIKDYNYGKI